MSLTKLPQTLAFVDTETTGLNPTKDRIIELGIIRVEGNEIVDKIDTVIKPYIHVPPEIFGMTGITGDEVARAPDFDEVSYIARQALEDAVFVAHNARFDYAFLKHEFGRQGGNFSAKVLCTVRLTRRLFPKIKRYSLESVISYFGLKPRARHRAFADAEVLWNLYNISLKNYGEDKVSEAVNSILKTPSLPSHLANDALEKLPETSGIYVFFGEDQSLPLYVGKSINIKDRVMGHFSGDYQSTTDLAMSSLITKVDAVETAGEIGALIRESDAIKTLMPVYNRQLRKRTDLIVALINKTSNYHALEIKNLQELKKVNADDILAVYKNRKNAKDSIHILCKEYNLCPKLLGLENGKGRCFSSQIGICYGACANEESVNSYNKRFIEAFEKTRIRKWPFETAVVIREENISGLSELHLVDRWMYLGSVVYSNKLPDEPKIEKYNPRFDWDIYKILVKAVSGSKNVRPVYKEEMNFWEQAGQAP